MQGLSGNGRRWALGGRESARIDPLRPLGAPASALPQLAALPRPEAGAGLLHYTVLDLVYTNNSVLEEGG